MVQMPSDFVDIRELARRTGRSVRSLREAERAGRLPRAGRDPLTDVRVWPVGTAEAIVAFLTGATTAKTTVPVSFPVAMPPRPSI